MTLSKLSMPAMNVAKSAQCLVLSTLLSLASFSAIASQNVSESANVDANSRIELKVQRGQVNISTWNKDEVTVEGTLDALSEGFIFKQSGNKLIIEDKLPRRYQSKNEPGSDLTIKLPANIKLEAEGVSADYRVKDIDGTVKFELVSGDIEANNLSGKVKVSTVSGEIKANSLNGSIELETVSGKVSDKNSQGEISYRLVSGDLSAKSSADNVTIDQVSGEVDASFVKATEVKAVIVSGDIELELGANLQRGRMESVSGDIELEFTGKPSLQVDIDGGPSGDIKNELTSDVPSKAKYTSQQRLMFTIGDGSGKLNINTISGDIELK
ncbi:DUF4097 domain-containing protein [Shewanella maritima]|uniref:DUF4097 family beta strand repeat-containing protein n=1 Tax=Shewanella maritima TaxID=2520507 RepID=UPI0037360707